MDHPEQTPHDRAVTYDAVQLQIVYGNGPYMSNRSAGLAIRIFLGQFYLSGIFLSRGIR
jgi:hypothetical protein